LVDAIGSMTGTLSGQVANALHQVLEAATAQAAELLGYTPNGLPAKFRGQVVAEALAV
jgi:hypothetical protein